MTQLQDMLGGFSMSIDEALVTDADVLDFLSARSSQLDLKLNNADSTRVRDIFTRDELSKALSLPFVRRQFKVNARKRSTVMNVFDSMVDMSVQMLIDLIRPTA